MAKKIEEVEEPYLEEPAEDSIEELTNTNPNGAITMKIPDFISRLLNRSSFVFWFLISLITLCAIPLSIISAHRQIITNTSDFYATTLLEPTSSDGEFNKLALSLEHYDVAASTVELKIKGYRSCSTMCGEYQDKLIFSSFPTKANGISTPLTTTVEIPSNTNEFVHLVTLPISGTLPYFPFDKYPFNLGMAVERTQDKVSLFLQPGSDEKNFSITMDENMSGMQISPPVLLDAAAVSPKKTPYKYLIAFNTTLNRPLYFRFFMSLIIVLFAVATLYM
ncbi:MAG: hypothetical protein NWQ13_02065, partial [Glaciimonas sp.]|nr:hypothetical protein [Glaciimonas sp.]